MAWIAPKTNWLAGDGIGFSDLNRIEGDIDYIYNFGLRPDVLSITSLDISLLKPVNFSYTPAATSGIHILPYTGGHLYNSINSGSNEDLYFETGGITSPTIAGKLFKSGRWGFGNNPTDNTVDIFQVYGTSYLGGNTTIGGSFTAGATTINGLFNLQRSTVTRGVIDVNSGTDGDVIIKSTLNNASRIFLRNVIGGADFNALEVKGDGDIRVQGGLIVDKEINPTTTPTESTTERTTAGTTILPRGNFSIELFTTVTTIGGAVINTSLQKLINGSWVEIASIIKNAAVASTVIERVNLLATYFSSGTDMRIVVSLSGSPSAEIYSTGVIIRKS